MTWGRPMIDKPHSVVFWCFTRFDGTPDGNKNPVFVKNRVFISTLFAYVDPPPIATDLVGSGVDRDGCLTRAGWHYLIALTVLHYSG